MRSLALGGGGVHYDVDKEAGDDWALALKLFDAVDDNGDGELSWAELHEYLSGPQARVDPVTTRATRVRHSRAIVSPDPVWDGFSTTTHKRSVAFFLFLFSAPHKIAQKETFSTGTKKSGVLCSCTRESAVLTTDAA